MATVPDWGFCGPSYQAQSLVFDAERSVNLYPEPGYKSAKSGMALIGTPGLSLFCTLPTGPVRGLWVGNNRLFACGGTHVYEVSSAGAVLTDYGAIAGSTGSFRAVTFAHNGNQLLVMDPTCGGGGGGISGAIFNVNPAGPSCDFVFNGGALTYLDTFFVALSSTSNSQLNISGPLDGTTWPGLDFVVRSGSADLCIQLEVLNGQLWIFGQKTTELWYNAGNPLFPFARIQGATLNIGLLAPRSVVKFSDNIMWLGGDEHGFGRVYMTKGTQAVPVSTPGIEAQLNAIFAAQGGTITYATSAVAYGEAGHEFYCLRPGGSANNPTFVYDRSTNMWHERTSSPDGITENQWIVLSTAASPFFNVGLGIYNFAGSVNSGKIYKMGLGFTNEDGLSIIRTRTSPHISNSNRRMTYNSLAFDADIGTAQMVLDYSNDGARTFLGRNYNVPKAGTAAATGMDYYKISQLGQSRDRVFKLKITDSANQIALVNAYLDATQGVEA